MIGIEKLKELANQYLNGEIDEEGFWRGRNELVESPDWHPMCERWLAQQILKTGEPGIVS